MLATTYGMRHHAGKSVRREAWPLNVPWHITWAASVMTGSTPARGTSPEERTQVLEPLVSPPQVVLRPVFAKRVEVLVFGIFEECIERPARRPFDEDQDRPRFDTWLRLHHISQPS